MTTTSSPTAPAASTVDAEVAAVAAVPGRIVAAWAQQDAAAFAAVFTPDGTMILPGSYEKGRERIQAKMAGSFAAELRGTRVAGSPIDLRFLSDDVAVVVTAGGVLAPGEETVSDARAIRATWVVARHEGEWLLAAYHNSQRDAV